MFCPKCGAVRDENDKFCRNCGFEFPAESKPETEYAQIPVETLKKAKFYKYSLRVIFCAFTVLALLFCFLPVTAYPFYGASSVYGNAFASGMTGGLDGRWDNFHFLAYMFLNIFTNVNFVITPCALTVFALIFCICFSISSVIVMLSKKRKTHAKAEASTLVCYVFFMIMFTVMTFGVILGYKVLLGAAPIMLLLLSLAAFITSLILYIKRKKFFCENPNVKDQLRIII